MSLSSLRAPTDVRTAHRTVTDVLRHAILSGQLAGGERLVQSEIASALQVSVTPVREALRDLAGEGLIRFDAFRGATVHTPSRDELIEIYGIRRILVPVAVRSSIANITDAEVDAADDVAKEMRTTVDAIRWLELNRRFHQALDTPARQPILQDILRRLADLSALYVGVSISPSTQRRRGAEDDHDRLIAAFRDRDADAAVEVALSHLEGTMNEVLRRLEAQSTVLDS